MMRHVLIPAVFLAACSSHTTYKTATPLGKGNSEVVLAPQAHGAGPRDRGKAVVPEISAGMRHGVSERIDIGATGTGLFLGDAYSTASAELSGKVHLWSSREQRLHLAVGSGVGYRVITSGNAAFEQVYAAVPVIVGVSLGRHQLALSPTVGWQRWYADSAMPVDLPFAGASVGFEWRATERLSILPEVSWSHTPVRMENQSTTALVHAGIGFMIRR